MARPKDRVICKYFAYIMFHTYTSMMTRSDRDCLCVRETEASKERERIWMLISRCCQTSCSAPSFPGRLESLSCAMGSALSDAQSRGLQSHWNHNCGRENTSFLPAPSYYSRMDPQPYSIVRANMPSHHWSKTVGGALRRQNRLAE